MKMNSLLNVSFWCGRECPPRPPHVFKWNETQVSWALGCLRFWRFLRGILNLCAHQPFNVLTLLRCSPCSQSVEVTVEKQHQRGDEGSVRCSFPVPMVCVQNVSSNIFFKFIVCLTIPKLVAECSWLLAPGQPWASGTHRELPCKVCRIVSGWGCSPGLGT